MINFDEQWVVNGKKLIYTRIHQGTEVPNGYVPRIPVINGVRTVCPDLTSFMYQLSDEDTVAVRFVV